MDSSDPAPQVNCTITVTDSQGQVTDTEVLTFAVTANPPGLVCTPHSKTPLHEVVLL
jgi:hypothetical protein